MPQKSIIGTVFNQVLFGGCKMAGEVSGSTFPRGPKELSRAGEKWLTLVLQQNGSLSADVVVESLRVEQFNNGGLLGEMCIVHVAYSGPTAAPTKMMAKFRPSDFETRITTSLFDICEHEFDFYRNMQPELAAKGLRCPKMIFGDFNRFTGSFIFLLEFVDAEFFKIQDPAAVSNGRDEAIFTQLAQLHSIYWGAEQQSIEFIPALNEGASKIIPTVTKKHLKTFYTGACASESVKIPDELQMMISEMAGGGGLAELQNHLSDSNWLTMFHGDPRTDNWFF